MSTKVWVLFFTCLILTRAALGQSGASHLTIGVALPQGQALQGAEAAEPMRQRLMQELKAQSIEAVALTASSDTLIEAEAQAKQCRYVLYTHLEKHGPGGLRGKLSALGGALPFAAFSAKGAASSLTGMAMQGAANAAAASAQQQVASSLGGSYATVKQGDTMAMAYRLVQIGSASPLKAESFDSAKAGGDGQDIVNPLLAQVAGAVAATARAGSSASGAPSTVSTASSDPAPSAPPSRFAGLWGHRSTGAKPVSGSTADSMDCAKLASMPNAPMSAEACEKLKSAQQTYNQAASEPSASRSGDEQMSCAQITAELKQQQYVAQDQTKVAAANATVKQEQAINKKEYANMQKMQAENQTAVAAATAADNATELSTGGLVRGHALEAAEKGIEARSRANNERVMREDLPVTQKMVGQTADLGADFAGQLNSNPRLARLMQLADAKHCKGGT